MIWKCTYCELCFVSKRQKYKHIHEKHYDMLPEKGKAWNSGKTKNTDERIKNYALKISESEKGGKNHFYGKQHSKETILKMKNNQNCGGLRIGSGHAKMGWYKGYYCRSSWELAWLIYQLEHEQKVEQCKESFEYKFNNEIHHYYPDFKIGEIYYEIKGQHFENLTAKLEQFPKEKTLILIDGKHEIKLYLDYVVEKYGKDFIKLYE